MAKKRQVEVRSYASLAAFSRNIGHRIRGPLSVIQNDLAYFQQFLPPKECERARAKCGLIAQVLSDAELPLLEQSKWVSVDLGALFKEVTSRTRDILCDETIFASRRTEGNPDLLRMALEGMADILRIAKVEESRIIMEGPAGEEAGEGEYTITLTFVRESCDAGIREESYDSFSDFLCLQGGLHVMAAPLLDAVFAAHGWTTHITATNVKGASPIFIEMRIPL